MIIVLKDVFAWTMSANVNSMAKKSAEDIRNVLIMMELRNVSKKSAKMLNAEITTTAISDGLIIFFFELE
jgi:hypothetical protein